MSADKTAFQVERIAFFSDAVFAIAITLMIIEVKPPHLHGTYHEQVMQLTALAPMFIGVALSFALIGVFWYRHHQLFRSITNYTTGFIVRNLVVLGTIIFIPFSTAFNFENGLDHGNLAIVFYCLNYFAASLANLILFRYALDPANGVSDGDLGVDRRHIFSELEFPLVVFVFVIVLSFVHPQLAPIGFALFGLQGMYTRLRSPRPKLSNEAR